MENMEKINGLIENKEYEETKKLLTEALTGDEKDAETFLP